MVQVVENATDVEVEIVEWHPTSEIAGHGLLVAKLLRVKPVDGLPSLVREERIGEVLQVYVRQQAEQSEPQRGKSRRLRIRVAGPNKVYGSFIAEAS